MEGLEGAVAEMRDLRIAFCCGIELVSYYPLEWVGYIHERQTYNNLRVPVADFGVVVFFYVGEGGVAGLFVALVLVY